MNPCPHCGAQARDDYPAEFLCGTIRGSRSPKCYQNEIDQKDARIAERDSARAIADQNWKLREEFVALLGTDDVKEGAHIVRQLKAALDMLCDAGAALRNFTPEETSRAMNWDRLEKKARGLV